MITITNNITETAANAFAKARECYVRRVAINQYLVTPKRYSKTRRLVTFILTGNTIKALCQDYYTGEECDANKFGKTCYHCAKALLHATSLANRESAKQAA